MKPLARVAASGALLLLAGVLQACCTGTRGDGATDDEGNGSASAGPAAPAGPLEVVDWGPRGTQAGVAFNVQPGGHSGLWLRVNQPLKGQVVLVQFGDAFLEGQVHGTVVTAIVPEEAYAQAGDYEVRVVARFGDEHWGSAPARFSVE